MILIDADKFFFYRCIENMEGAKKIPQGHIEVHDPRAIKDLFTYGPKDIIKKILLDMNLKEYIRTCGMNLRLVDICRDDDFRREYFNLHEKEVYNVLKSIILDENLKESHIAFYKEWSALAGDRWDPSAKRNSILVQLIQSGLHKNIELLLQDSRVDPSAYRRAIPLAAAWYKTSVVKLLLEDGRADPATDNNEALMFAVEKGLNDIVKLLLEDGRADPTSNNNYALSESVSQGDIEIVKLLLQHPSIDPSYDNNDALYEAVVSEGRSDEVVKLLLKDPRVNPSDPRNNALKRAVGEGGSRTIVKLLLDDPKTDATVNNHEVLNNLYQFPNKKMLDLVKKWYKDHKIPIPKPEDIRGSSPDDSSEGESGSGSDEEHSSEEE